MTDIINENSTGYATATFLNKDGGAVSPVSAVYQIDCITTGTAIRASTPLTPAPAIEITLDANDTAIIDDCNQYEKRLVTVTATYGLGDTINETYTYLVKNLKFVT